MLKPYEPTEEARQVLAELRREDIYFAEALLLTSEGVYCVNGLLYLLNRPEQYIATPVHKNHLPKHLYGDVVYLRPFRDVAETIRAPFGGDTVYQIKPRLPRPRTGAYKLPAPANR